MEPMNVPHRSQMNNHDTTPLLDDICEPTIPENKGRAEEPKEDIVLQPQPQHQHQHTQ